MYKIVLIWLFPVPKIQNYTTREDGDSFNVQPRRRDSFNYRRNTRNRSSISSRPRRMRGRYHLDTGVVPHSPNPQPSNSNTCSQRDRSNLATQQAIEALGRKATIYTADLSSQAEVAALTPTILKDGHKISILVNCAGIQRRHPSAQFPDNDWNEVLPPLRAM